MINEAINEYKIPGIFELIASEGFLGIFSWLCFLFILAIIIGLIIDKKNKNKAEMVYSLLFTQIFIINFICLVMIHAPLTHWCCGHFIFSLFKSTFNILFLFLYSGIYFLIMSIAIKLRFKEKPKWSFFTVLAGIFSVFDIMLIMLCIQMIFLGFNLMNKNG